MSLPARNNGVNFAVTETLVPVRGFRWRGLIESGRYCSIQEIAAAEKINASYVGRILRLTLLAPDIVEGILARPSPAAEW
jgi:S-adenosylmethionine synthetase